MGSADMRDADWLAGFAGLDGLGVETRHTLAAEAPSVALPAGTVVFRPGSPCERFLFVLDGSVRVQMIGESGREIVLYRVAGGDSCVLTTACLLAHEPYPAEGVAETAVRARVLPAAGFERLMGMDAAFRRFVFAAYGSRIAGLLALVQEVAFRRVDLRLARLLLAHGPEVAMTHERLATELGTAREVVSRQLKEFERRGLVRLGRGGLAVVDAAALGNLADRLAS